MKIVKPLRWSPLLKKLVQPNFQLALWVGILGIFNVLPLFERLTGLHFYGHTLAPVTEDMALGRMGGWSEASAGAVLLLMCAGLAWRSRFAWIITVLMTLAILVRIFTHHVEASPLAIFNSVLLVAMLYFRREFDRSSLAAETALAVLSLLSLGAYAVFGTYLLGPEFSPPVTNLLTALYFSVTTLSTVGYGDIVPKTTEARIFVMSVIVIGVSIFAASLSTVVIPLVNKRLRRNALGEQFMKREQHTIIVGDTPLARNTALAIRARGLPVTVIARQLPPDRSVGAVDDDGRDDLLIGDPTDIELLKRAGVADAVSLMALLEDDAENAFVILAAREVGTAARTVIAVRGPNNVKRVRLARPDLIIAPELFSSEILAMNVSGENIDSSSLLDKIFNTDTTVPAQR